MLVAVPVEGSAGDDKLVSCSPCIVGATHRPVSPPLSHTSGAFRHVHHIKHPKPPGLTAFSNQATRAHMAFAAAAWPRKLTPLAFLSISPTVLPISPTFLPPPC